MNLMGRHVSVANTEKVRRKHWLPEDYFVAQAITPYGDLLGYDQCGRGLTIQKSSLEENDWEFFQEKKYLKAWRCIQETGKHLEGDIRLVIADKTYCCTNYWERVPHLDEPRA